jgi:hypothetical protein
MAWLDNLRVLRCLPDGAAPKNGALSEAGGSGDEEEASCDDPCPICGRTYFHVHKSGVPQGGVVVSDSD